MELGGTWGEEQGTPEVMSLGKAVSKGNVSTCISAAPLHGHYVLLSISADICSGDKRLGNKCALQQIKLAVRKSCSSRELISPIKTLPISKARERWVFRVL